MPEPDPLALLALLPLLVLAYRVSRAPYRFSHFLFEYTAFLLHAFLSLTEGQAVLALLPPVAIVSYLLYYATRGHERVLHVVVSVMVVATTTELGQWSPVAVGFVMAPQVLMYAAYIARFVRSWVQAATLVLMGFTAVVSIAVTEPAIQWALRSVAYILALLMCPTERVPVPYTPVEIVLRQAMEAAAAAAAAPSSAEHSASSTASVDDESLLFEDVDV
jgi:hypothetical protein